MATSNKTRRVTRREAHTAGKRTSSRSRVRTRPSFWCTASPTTTSITIVGCCGA